MSGDIDLCRRTADPIPLRRAQELMGQLVAKGGPPVSRRRHSSSDRRLRAAFKGERGPEFSA